MKLLFIIVCMCIHHALFAQDQCGSPVRKTYPVLNFVSQAVDPDKVDSIPVIFHVLYKNQAENLPDSLITALLTTTAQDLMGDNADLSSVPEVFRPFIGKPNIKLYLAAHLPDGSVTTGIIRQKTKTPFFKYNRREAFHESKLLDTRKYLNVYICDVNSGTNAFTPGEDAYDGIVIDYTKVKKGSRTLTHEIGHWLDVRHVFLSACGNGDGVKDTPAQKKTASGYCPCHPYITCSQPSMFMNFMDYSGCRYFFTAGQVSRMKDYIVKYKEFK